MTRPGLTQNWTSVLVLPLPPSLLCASVFLTTYTWITVLTMSAFILIVQTSEYGKEITCMKVLLLFSRSVMSTSLWCHGLQHTRLPHFSLSPRFPQTYVHWVSDTIQPFHPLSSPSPPTLNLSQGLFQWVSSLHQVAKVLELQLQHKSVQWIFRVDLLYHWLVWFPCSPRNSQESSPVPHFESINSE